MRYLNDTLLICSVLAICYGCGKTTDTDYRPPETASSFNYKGQHYNTGDTVFGFKNYVYLVVGDLDAPLAIGLPHDGTAYGNPTMPETGTTGRDLSPLPLGLDIASLFEQDTQLKPWLIVKTIHRKAVDPNTYPEDAAVRYTTPDALETYNSYHELLSVARSTIAQSQHNGNGALFLDLHGHAHKYHNGHTEHYVSVLSGNLIEDNFIFQNDIGYAISNSPVFAVKRSCVRVSSIRTSST